MSDYYQQEVTKFMMRRAKRRAADLSTLAADTTVDDNPVSGGWLARLGSIFAERRMQPQQIAPALPHKTTKPAC